MKIIKTIKSGAIRALRSSRALFIIWIVSFAFLATVAFPLKRFMSSALGNSKATDLLKEGFSLSFFQDMGSAFEPMMSGLLGGFVLMILIFSLIYIFFNGGLFDSLRNNSCGYRTKDFLYSSAKMFLSFFAISALMFIMILFAIFLIIVIPLIIQRSGGSGSEEGMWKLISVIRIVCILVLPVFLLIADYSRAWLVANNHKKVFIALRYGFKATFSGFFPSYFFMLIMVIIQGLYIILVSKLVGGYNPATGGGLFLMFLVTQGLFFIKLWLRALRYGGVTSMYMM